MLDAGLHHMLQLVFILRRHDHHIRHVAQIGIVECPVVRRPVFRNQPAAIDAEDHRKILRGDIVHHLIVRALQEGRIHRHHRTQTLRRKIRPQTSRHAVRQSPRRTTGPEILFRNHVRPVPSHIAAVMATIRLSSRASLTNESMAICV